MSRFSLLLLVVVVGLLLSVLPSAVRGQTSTWYLCAVLQGSRYQSIDVATLTVNSTTTQQADYNGNTNTAYSVISLTSGNRTFTDLTSSSRTPITVAMTSLAPPGSTGGNDNLFWPNTRPQMLDGNGITVNFASNVSVSGQSVPGTQMNLWWQSGSNSLGEEVRGGTHESAPLQSTLIISQTQPTCAVPNYAQFSMCLLILGNGYTSSISTLLNTTGTPSTVAPSSTNGLSATLQGWTAATVANGQRVLTYSNGSSTTTTLTGIASANSVQGNDNLVFPDSAGSPAFDAAGVAFALASAAPLGDGSAASTVVIKGTSASSYFEQSTGAAQSTTTSYLSLVPYVSGTSLPPCSAISTQYQYCWSVTSSLFTSSISGTLTIIPLAAGSASTPYYTVTSITGTRTYTDLTTGAVTVSTITALLPTGSIGGNDNLLYIGQSPLLDGDGISVSFNNVPPIYGQTNVTGQTTTMNLWWNGPTYLEENEGGTHEQNATSSSFTITASSSTAAPTCSGCSHSATLSIAIPAILLLATMLSAL